MGLWKACKKCWCTYPKWKYLHQWIYQPTCCIKGTQNASLLKIRKPQLSHCFSGLPGQTYMIDVNTAISFSPWRISHEFSSQQEKVKLREEEKSSTVQLKKRRLQLRERRSSGSQQQLRDRVAYESSVSLENISVSSTTTIPALTSLPESDIIKDIENFYRLLFLTLRLLIYQMIVRFELLILMVWHCLISMFIQVEALVLGQQKLQVL